jgi:hypothetical protein
MEFAYYDGDQDLFYIADYAEHIVLQNMLIRAMFFNAPISVVYLGEL